MARLRRQGSHEREVNLDKPRVLAVYKKSAYQIYIEEQKHQGFSDLIKERDPEALRLLSAHEEHTAAMERARALLKQLDCKVAYRHRARAGAHQQDFDLVVALGGDGTVLEAAKYCDASTPLLSLNTAPSTSMGYFAAATAGEPAHFDLMLTAAVLGELNATEINRMDVRVGRGEGRVQKLSTRVLNDILFCHHNPAATSRYTIRTNAHDETQRSSGVWVGTAAGSTGATLSAGGDRLDIDSACLQYVVRELCDPMNRLFCRKGYIHSQEILELQSHMRTARVYIDGHRTAAHVMAGQTVFCRVADEPLLILGFRGWSRS